MRVFRGRIPLWLKIAVPIGVLLIGVVVAGFVHIVRGERTGVMLCGKDGWALQDTLVNADDFYGRDHAEFKDKPRVLRALYDCDVLKRPEQITTEFVSGLVTAIEAAQCSPEQHKSSDTHIAVHCPGDGCSVLRAKFSDLPEAPPEVTLECGNLSKGLHWRAEADRGRVVVQ